MAKWVRNWLTPLSADAWGSHHAVMMYKELLLVFGYTVNSDNGDAAWTSVANILVDEPGGANGFQVAAGSPREIYDPLGRFTQAMADDKVTIGLRGGLLNDDQNHSLWAITEYIDANHVKVDREGFNPFGWVTDTQLAGRIVRFDGLRLGNTAWVLMDGPSGERVQVRLEHSSTSFAYIQIAPFGKALAVTGQGTPDAITGTAPAMKVTIAGLIGRLNKHMVGLNVTIAGAANALDDGTFPITAVDTTTGEISYTNAAGVGDANFTGTVTVAPIATLTPTTLSTINIGDYYNRQFRMNAYQDALGLVLYGINQDEDWHQMLITKLAGADAEDSDSWLIWGKHGWLSPYEYGATDYMFALNGAVTPAQVTQWFTWLVRNTAVNDSDSLPTLFGRRINIYRKTPIREPWIVMDDVVGAAAVRGRVQQMRLGQKQFANIRPLDSAGFWLHWRDGMYVPRNGPQDPLPLIPPFV